MSLNTNIAKYVSDNTEELYKVLYDLCHIPAPSHHEEKRADYCLKWFHKNGMTDAYIDEALNVVYPYQANDRDRLTVMVAHTDTVFPDTEPMPYEDDGEYIRCPGVGDDTASVAVLMLTAKYFHENDVKTSGVLFVCNSCEEGLGNLKGTRFLFEKYKNRIAKFITFDSHDYNSSADRCVGSHRYEVEVLTEGGHSWGKFGIKNAIAELSKIVNRMYSINLPQKEGKKVTYNVGGITGGTSINTIAQQAKMLCEYRSNDVELLAFMKAEFEKIFTEANADDVTVNFTKIGDRPCAGDVDQKEMDALKKVAADVILEITGSPLTYKASSTDCNIPLSLGIPAISVGVYLGFKGHTREEYIIKSSLITGLEIGIKTTLGFAK